MKAEIFIGPPGTGKTTTLLSEVEKAIKNGTEPEKIGYVSFTKKSVAEAVIRAKRNIDAPNNGFRYFKTIHALCFMLLGLKKEMVLSREQYGELGRMLGLRIKGSNAQDFTTEELEKGDALVFVEALARMKMIPIEEAYEADDYGFSIYELIQYKKTLDKYKSVRCVYDFTDMLTRFLIEGVAPELDILFVDEAQDLCLLQWRIIEKLAQKAKRVVIAGDDDQAIYRWSGADVEYFIDLTKKNQTKVLDISYRLPIEIYEYADKIIKDIEDRVSKKYTPRNEKGSVQHTGHLSNIDMSEGQWLILARNSFVLIEAEKTLRMMGLTYKHRYGSTTNEKALKAAISFERVRKGERISEAEAVHMLSYTSSRSLFVSGRKETWDRVSLGWGELPPWFTVLDLMGEKDRTYYLNVRQSGRSLIEEPRITVSTIHGAKGGESENVVLLTDISNRVWNNLLENPDDESRVLYVAVTRAKQNLYIVEPETDKAFFLW